MAEIQTPALKYVLGKGWAYKPSTDNRIELEICPYCRKPEWGHFYMIIEESNKDGLHMCHRCGKSGNLRTLQEYKGDAQPYQLQALSDDKKKELLPDIDEAHALLLNDDEALGYLYERGFSNEIIIKQKLGLKHEVYFRKAGKAKALVYPYLTANGSCNFVHYRSLPPAEKDFTSPKGHDAPLYNGLILEADISDLVMVEGEANTIIGLDRGIQNIVGVPGANFKKALWIDELERFEKVYICYDKDSVGQKAAQTLASRIGIDKCYKIILPDFVLPSGKQGKDLNEWFQYGNGTAEAFEALKAKARQFDVQGVTSTMDAIDALELKLEGKTSLMPTYGTPWASLNKLVGLEDGDVLDILAPEKVGKTTFGMNIMDHAVSTYGEDGVIICLEMDSEHLVRKWISHVTSLDDSIPKNEEEGRKKLAALKEAIPAARAAARERDGQLYFCYPAYKSPDDIYKLIVDCIRRYGVKWIMFDNIQLLADRTLGGKNRTIHLSQISKELAGLAKDYGIKMVRILQPHRIDKGETISTDNVDGSSQIAKDCDAMITLF